jgi:hypothetical protein
MPSGGARARSGPAPDPNSYRSLDREWVDLPADGYTGPVPSFPLAEALEVETELWAELWAKPQGAAWASLGLKFQVAAYVRAYVKATAPDAVNGWSTVALRMEAELGLSLPGMRQNGWRISDGTATAPATTAPAARKTSSGDWLKAVSVEGA